MPQLNKTASMGAANSMSSSLLSQAESGAAAAGAEAEGVATKAAAAARGGVNVLDILKGMKLKQDDTFLQEVQKLTVNGLQEMEAAMANIEKLGSGVGKNGTP